MRWWPRRGWTARTWPTCWRRMPPPAWCAACATSPPSATRPTRLARDFPHITLIVNHTGLPSDRSAAGLEAWREALTRVAQQPNTAVKISGIGTPGTPWSVQHNRRVVNDAIAIFGVERCMFASNFPVDRLCGDFATIMGGFMAIVSDFTDADQRRLFHDNAVRFYRL